MLQFKRPISSHDPSMTHVQIQAWDLPGLNLAETSQAKKTDKE